MKDHKPTWGPVGEMGIDWRGQIDALDRDGYNGWISLETHWTGPERGQVRGEHDLRAGTSRADAVELELRALLLGDARRDVPSGDFYRSRRRSGELVKRTSCIS